MLWIWSCPVSTKELFLKIAVPKRQTKSLKSNCEVVSFYYICKLCSVLYLIYCHAIHETKSDKLSNAIYSVFATFALETLKTSLFERTAVVWY